jgi:hypothetical protein
MRPPRTFVKRVNTTYCAFYLGQTQDVDACAPLWKSTQHPNRGEWEAALRLPPGAQAGCSEGFCLLAGREKNEVIDLLSKRNAMQFSEESGKSRQ